MSRGDFILGQEVDAFEVEWARHCDRRYAVGVGNGFDALRLMLEAYGIGSGDDVIVPSNTYIATWMAVSAVGATVVPVEPDIRTALIDPARVEQAMASGRIRAVLAVHLYGRQCDMAALSAICDRHGALLLVDAAQGHGLLELGDAAAFSFYPTKNLGALGDGGAVVTDNGRIAERVRWLRSYGSNGKDVHVIRGGNSRLDELQAAFLRVKLGSLLEWNDRRSMNATRYDEALGAAFASPAGNVSHIYCLRSPHRNWLRSRLASQGVDSMVHYPTPPHLQQAYFGNAWREGSFPVAERLARECVSLPAGPELTRGQVDRVIAAVRHSLKEAA